METRSLRAPDTHNALETLADAALADLGLMATAFDGLAAEVKAAALECKKEKALAAQERAEALQRVNGLNADTPPDPPKD